MCEGCQAYDNENDEWEFIGCSCACAEEDRDPNAYFEDDSTGTQCKECGHKVE